MSPAFLTGFLITAALCSPLMLGVLVVAVIERRHEREFNAEFAQVVAWERHVATTPGLEES